jgi:uncharacterized protein YqgV (UPF0045/DUF77 family)
VAHIDFTIEPFVEGQPGAHVTEPIAALAALGITAEFGAFGSSCEADHDMIPEVVAAVLKSAFNNGATRVNVDVVGAPDT